ERGAEQGKGWQRTPGTLPAPRGLLSPAVRALAGQGRAVAAPPCTAGKLLCSQSCRGGRAGIPGRSGRLSLAFPPPCSVTSQHRQRSPRGKAVRVFPSSFPPIARGDGRGRTSLCRRRGLSDLQSFVPGGNRSISLVFGRGVCWLGRGLSWCWPPQQEDSRDGSLRVPVPRADMAFAQSHIMAARRHQHSRLIIEVDEYSSNPTQAFTFYNINQGRFQPPHVQMVDPVPHDAPKPPGYTRFVCISDTHSRTDPIQMPYGDVLIHAGDFTELGLPSEVKKFNEWLGNLGFMAGALIFHEAKHY
uniref:Metallophosphoesterase domain containing 1 n=1 Tax=Cyanistes caeruleus TaxID=156563 RepID=A0A8C0UBY3_CYACU